MGRFLFFYQHCITPVFFVTQNSRKILWRPQVYELIRFPSGTGRIYGAPVILDAQLSVQDSPNYAGVVIDAISYEYVARELGLVGALIEQSASTQKTPPY